MATSTYGVLNEFHAESEPITAYIERVSNYFAANEIPADKQVSVLYTDRNRTKDVCIATQSDGTRLAEYQVLGLPG